MRSLRRARWLLLAIVALTVVSSSSAVAMSSSPAPPARFLGLDILPMATGHPAVVERDGALALQEGSQVQPWDFTGMNAYQLSSRWGVNSGCGWGGWSDATLDQFFSTLPANALVRTWFFQSDATSIANGVSVRNWQALDDLVTVADRHNVHLVLTLGNEDGTCDDATWKGPSWYAGGYRSVAAGGSPAGPGKTSYAQWVADAVGRYADQASIAMWEPMNEPQPATCRATPGWDCWSQRSCPSEVAARQALIGFYDVIGAEIHRLDPEKLVSDGSFGGDGCGTETPSDFERVIASPGIDVVGYHDYSGQVSPPDLAPRTAEAAAVGKATMVGEAGVTGCASADERAALYASKIRRAQQDGVAAYLAWWYDNDQGAPSCDGPLAPDSPAWAAILDAARPTGLSLQTTPSA